jgi:hypothetical protein
MTQHQIDRSAHYTDAAHDEAIRRYKELACDRPGAMMALTCSLPCCVRSDGRLCGRGATMGYVVPEASGTWILVPVCTACIQAMAIAHEASRAR